MAVELNTSKPQPQFNDVAFEQASKMGGADSTKLKEVVNKAMEVLAGANLKVSRADKAGADGVGEKKTTGATNIPALDNPGDLKQLEADLTKLIAFLQLDNEERQTEMAKERINMQKDNLKTEHEGRMKEINETIKKMKDAEKAALASRIFGWLGAIVAVVAAVALTVVTGGAAAGFAIAGAALAVTSLIMNETGATEKLIEKLAEKFEEDGLSKSSAKLKAALVVNLTMLAASLVCSVGGMAAGLASAANSAAQTASTISTTAKTVQNVITISNTAIMASALVTGGGSTYFTKRSEEAQADTKELEAFLQRLQQYLDESQEELQILLQQIEAGLGKLTEMIASATDTSKEIAENLGQMA